MLQDKWGYIALDDSHHNMSEVNSIFTLGAEVLCSTKPMGWEKPMTRDVFWNLIAEPKVQAGQNVDADNHREEFSFRVLRTVHVQYLPFNVRSVCNVIKADHISGAAKLASGLLSPLLNIARTSLLVTDMVIQSFFSIKTESLTS